MNITKPITESTQIVDATHEPIDVNDMWKWKPSCFPHPYAIASL